MNKDVRAILARDLREQRNAVDFDTARLFRVDVEVEQAVEEDIFRRQPGHVAPHVARDCLDLFLGLFRIGFAQIVDRDAMAADQRP